MITHPSPLVCVITDRRLLPRKTGQELNPLTEFIERAIKAEVDLLQIREPDLSARDLLALADAAARIAQNSSTRILVNDRADVAACAGTGVHLTTRSLPPDVVLSAFGSHLLVGASTHSVEEAESAEQRGAHFVVFGPVFYTESKRMYGPAVGLDALQRTVARVNVPVLALGGIKQENFRQALDAGAAGIAGISIFVLSNDLNRTVKEIRAGSSGPQTGSRSG